ncbi:hypothetical protein DFQ28_011392 [Apophysomyces sp. BC1034]|nr:hypothetical protein DFQ28_011392 [Apophysomyces sp. BC1034]
MGKRKQKKGETHTTNVDNDDDFQPVVPFKKKQRLAKEKKAAIPTALTAAEAARSEKGSAEGDAARKVKGRQFAAHVVELVTADHRIKNAQNTNHVGRPPMSSSALRSEFVATIRRVVKHIRDATYVGFLFAYYHILQLINQDKPLPIISQDLCYNHFVVVADKGMHVDGDIRLAFQDFQRDVPSFGPAYFMSRGYMTLIAEAVKQYEEGIRNHTVANFEKKTIQYLLIRFSDEKDKCYLGKTTIAARKALAQYAYTVPPRRQVVGISAETKNLPSSVKRDKDLEKLVKGIICTLFFGPSPITVVELNATPHLYIPWMYIVLQRLEQKVLIQDEEPQDHVSNAYAHRKVHEFTGISTLSNKLIASFKDAVRLAIRSKSPLKLPKIFTKSPPNTEWAKLLDFVQPTVSAIKNKTFRPLKYTDCGSFLIPMVGYDTDPRGHRRFTMLPINSFQCRHIMVDRQALGKLLCDSGTLIKPAVPSTEKARRLYFDMFDIKNIGYRTMESLATEKPVFWDTIRTDGLDVEFTFERLERTASKTPLAQTDLWHLATGATIWEWILE